MAFTAKKSDNTIAAVVNDYEATIAGGLQLLGYGYVNYAEEVANNFVRVAENFSNTVPPVNPLKGQLWWDTSDGANPALWVCRDPTAAATPVTARWSQIFAVSGSGDGDAPVDAWTLRNYAPSVTSVADTVVVRDGTGKIDANSLPTIATGATNLDGLTDVTIVSPSANQIIKYSGSEWVNGTISLSDLSNVNTTGAVDGSVLKFNGTNWVVGTDLQASGGSGGSTWGSITGVLSSQTDLISYIDNHNWAISDVTNLQNTLDGKLSLASLKASDGSGSGIDADLLDGQHGAYYLNYANFTGTPPDAGNAITAHSYATNGYVNISGFIIQWGRAFVSSSPTTTYVTLPITFPTANLVALGHPSTTIDTGDEGDETIYVRPYSKSQVAINVDGDFSSVYVYFIAMGY